MAKSKSANVLDLIAAKAQLKAIKAEVQRLSAVVAMERENARNVRRASAEEKARKAIERAQKRLEKLAGPVGVKAKKVAKKPGKPEVVVAVAETVEPLAA